MSFVHPPLPRSEYSLLDGANRIDDLIARAVEFEQPALAITDHGNLHAAWEFQEKAHKQGIKPIIGMEAYVAPGDRRTKARATPGDRSYYHLVLLARDRVGYQNLIKLSSLAYTEGFYGKPRVDRELLAKYNEGIIVSSACMAGEVARHLLEDRTDEAQEAAEWYANVFKDRYYLEVQAAHEAGEQKKLNAAVFKLAKKLNLPVVATNDAHFLRETDHDAHDVLLCIGLKKDRLDDNRMKYDRGLYFKNAQEIREHFHDRPDVLTNTLAIADQAGFTFEKKYFLPAFPLPKGAKSENDLLVKLATAGAHERYPSATGDKKTLPANVQERLDFELGVISKTGYAGNLLIVADFVARGARKGIPVRTGPCWLRRRLARCVRLANHRRLPAQVRSPLRTIPESRARVDARHRRGFLRRAPRRGDRLRPRQVRSRLRRPGSSPSVRSSPGPPSRTSAASSGLRRRKPTRSPS